MIVGSNTKFIKPFLLELASVIVLCFAAGRLGLDFLPFVVFSVLALANQKVFITFSIFVTSLILVLSEPSYTVSLPIQNLAFMQIVPAGSAFGQNYDEAILVGAMLIILRNLSRLRQIPVASFTKWLMLTVVVICLSWLFNGLSLVILINYLTTYLRFPVLFIAFVLIPDWSLDQLAHLLKVIFFICLPAQLVFGVLQNLSAILDGKLVVMDGLSGTFNYPIGDWSTTFVTIGMIYMLSKMLRGFHMKYLMGFLFGALYLLSASQNLSTIVALTTIVLMLAWFLLFAQETSRSLLRRGGGVFIGVTSVVLVLGVAGKLIIDSIDPLLVESLTNYFTAKLDQQNVVLGISPKILTYFNLIDLFQTGAINALWGAGPGMYLSGLALYNFGSDLTAQYSTVGQIEWLFGGTGRGDAMENNVVAFAGEIGIIGLVAMYMLLVSVMWYIRRNCRFVKDPRFSAVGDWVIFTMVFFCLYSSLVLVFEIQPFIIFLAILCGTAVKTIELSKEPPTLQSSLA